MTPNTTRITALVEELESMGCKAEHLDEAVQAGADELAQNANNGGLLAQVEFLLNTCEAWSRPDIIYQAQKAKNEDQ